MKPNGVREVEILYDQTLRFLQGGRIGEKSTDQGPSRTEYQNTFRTVPEKYLLNDNLLLLLKDV
jgi:hypothetical protein